MVHDQTLTSRKLVMYLGIYLEDSFRGTPVSESQDNPPQATSPNKTDPKITTPSTKVSKIFFPS